MGKQPKDERKRRKQRKKDKRERFRLYTRLNFLDKKVEQIQRTGGNSGRVATETVIKEYCELPSSIQEIWEDQKLRFGHVDLPDYDHIIDCLVDLNEKEALLTEAWGNRRCGGFSKERHINLMKEVLGDAFFGMVDEYCLKLGLRIKKGGVVVYCEDSYQAYHKDRAKFHTRVLLQMGVCGKRFCLKRKRDEIAITVEHGTIMFMTHDLACEDGETDFYHGVPMTLNAGKVAGSSIMIIDLVEV